MIHERGWKHLKDRRKYIRLTMLYKIINAIANVILTTILKHLQIPELQANIDIHST